MRVVVQRVSRATVTVDGRVVGSIGTGLVLLVGFSGPDAVSDGGAACKWMAEKIIGLRIFADAEGRLNRDVRDVGGSLLVVSQFTLYGDVRRGRRPSFVEAARPEDAERLYDEFVALLVSAGVAVQTGKFGAIMHVELINEGPVTLVLER